MATDQVSFYDESLKKQIEGSFKTDGKSIHVSSAYGVMSFPYNELRASIDHDAQVLLVQKLLSELARDPDSGKFKDLQQQRGDQQPQGIGSTSAWGGGNGPGAGTPVGNADQSAPVAGENPLVRAADDQINPIQRERNPTQRLGDIDGQ